MKLFYFSVGAIFKNEGHCIVEWLNHYLDEGAEHFYLIDNGSSDDFFLKITPYFDKITLIKDDSKHSQTRLYNEIFKKNRYRMVRCI